MMSCLEVQVLLTPVAESATRLTASIAVPQSHYVSWQFLVRWLKLESPNFTTH